MRHVQRVLVNGASPLFRAAASSVLASRSSRFALVAVVGTLVLSFNWGSRLLLTNDDTRFPVLARDVLVKGHWLLPALPDGTFHLVKPPLAVWLIAIASWPTGSVSVRTAVLPSLLAAIGVILLTYWLGCRLFGPDPGVIGGLTVATTVGVYTMAHSSMPDMVQLIAGTGAIAVYVAAGFAAKRAWLVLFYGLLGLGSLAKGVAGFVWLGTVFVMMAVSGKQRERYYLPLCPAAALLIGWWYSTLAWRGRARAFAGAWIAVVAAGIVLVKLDTPHFNATTDLHALQAVL